MSKNKTQQMLVRVDSELLVRFDKAIAKEAEMHAFEEHDRSMVVRNMMRDFIARVESTAESAMGREAARVLRGRRAS
jgi:metal-responsive CopG/Arc/MetJ family transcriptional regulator